MFLGSRPASGTRIGTATWPYNALIVEVDWGLSPSLLRGSWTPSIQNSETLSPVRTRLCCQNTRRAFRLSAACGNDKSAVQFRQQLVSPAQVRDYDAAANHKGHVDGFLLLGASYAQPVRLDDMVVDAVVAAQASRGNQSHQFLVFRR